MNIKYIHARKGGFQTRPGSTRDGTDTVRRARTAKWVCAILTVIGMTPLAMAAPVEIKNGGDNGGTTYVDGATAAGDTVIRYEDSAATPNVQNGTSNIVTVQYILPIVKEIRDLTGAIQPDGIALAKGQTIYYVLYVWNRTSGQTITDLRLSDTLPAGITFAGPIEVFNGGVGGDPASSANWTTGSNWQGLAWDAETNGTGDDTASFSGGTLVIGKASNTQVDVNSNNVFAVRFQVKIN